MSQQLDRHKPLWEMWMVEGLSQNRWALITKVHHSVVDGVAGAELVSAILDEDREPPPSPSEDWQAERRQSGPELAAAPWPSAPPTRRCGRCLAHPAAPPRWRRDRRRPAHPCRRGEAPPPSSLNGPIGPHRRWDWARSELSEVKRVRKAFGGTVNDVVLSAIAGGFRELLASRGEQADRDVRTLVPVSVRTADEHEYNNRVSAIFADLPVGIEDPLERLSAVHEQMEHLKHSHSAVAGDVLVGLTGFAPAMLLSLGLRAATHVPQRVQTVTTNVPGPQKTRRRPAHARASPTCRWPDMCV